MPYVPPGDSQQLTDIFFPRWNTSVQAVNTSTGFARLACIGDSITEGVGAEGTIYDAWPGQLEALLNGGGVDTQDGAIWGNTYWNTDARISEGTGWARWASSGWGPAEGSVLNRQWLAPTSASGDLSFTFPHSIDTINVYCAVSGGDPPSGVFTVDVDGGSSLGSYDTGTGADILGKATFTCTPGVHTININPPTGDTVFIVGVEAYLSTFKSILISNAGASSTQTYHWTTSDVPWARAPMFDSYPADLYTILLGHNDFISSISPTTMKARLKSVVQNAQIYGDVLLLSCVPPNPAPQIALEAAYRPLMIEISDETACGFLDLSGVFIDWATADGNGLMSDIYHPNADGYVVLAQAVYDAITEITNPSFPAPPVSLTDPVASGTPRVGQLLTTTDGTWDVTPDAFEYQWQRSPNGIAAWNDIVGATATTYTIDGGDVGYFIRSRVIAELIG